MNFRKLSSATWLSPADPTCYGELDLDLPETFSGSPLALVVHRAAQALKAEPQANSYIFFGQLRKRKSIDITIVVQPLKTDLQFITIKNADHLSLQEIESEIAQKSTHLKNGKPEGLASAGVWIDWTPWLLLPLLIRIYQFLAFELGLSLSFAGLPKWPFGSLVVTNIGSFGLRRGYAPLVPISRAALTITIAKVDHKPVWSGSEWKRQVFAPLGIVFDHRIIDGVHAGRLMKAFLS